MMTKPITASAPKNRRAGFTLIELIIVIAIIGILAAIIIPNYNAYTKKARQASCDAVRGTLTHMLIAETMDRSDLSGRLGINHMDITAEFPQMVDSAHCPENGKYEVFTTADGSVVVGCSKHAPIAGKNLQGRSEDLFKWLLLSPSYGGTKWVSGWNLKQDIYNKASDKTAPLGRIVVNGVSYVVKVDMQAMPTTRPNEPPVAGTKQAVTVTAGALWGQVPGQNGDSSFKAMYVYNDRNNKWYQFTKNGAPAESTTAGKNKKDILDATTSSAPYEGGKWVEVAVEYKPAA